jgi:hypothetical protein
MTLMYWREYRTEFHIGLTYGVSEASVCRIVQKVETALLRSGQFRLPGKKVLRENDMAIEVVVVDATEQPIERPKKTTPSLQREKEAAYAKSPNNHPAPEPTHSRHSLCHRQNARFSIVQAKSHRTRSDDLWFGRCRLSRATELAFE